MPVSLQQQIDRLRDSQLNMRADMFAYRIALHASFIAMTPAARQALRTNFQTLGEQAMSHGLATSKAADDSTVHAMQAALNRLQQALESLPSS